MDEGDKIVFFLTKNPERAKELYNLHETNGIDELTKVAMRFWTNPKHPDFPKVAELQAAYDLLSKKNGNKKKKYSDRTIKYWVEGNRLECIPKIITLMKKNPLYVAWENTPPRKRKLVEEALDKEAEEKNVPTQKPAPVVAKKEDDPKPVVEVAKEPEAPTPRVLGPPQVLRMDTILFPEKSIQLDKVTSARIAELLSQLKADSLTAINLEGFASHTGSRGTNFAISASRCYEVKKLVAERYPSIEFRVFPVGESGDANFRAVVITFIGYKNK